MKIEEPGTYVMRNGKTCVVTRIKQYRWNQPTPGVIVIADGSETEGGQLRMWRPADGAYVHSIGDHEFDIVAKR